MAQETRPFVVERRSIDFIPESNGTAQYSVFSPCGSPRTCRSPLW